MTNLYSHRSFPFLFKGLFFLLIFVGLNIELYAQSPQNTKTPPAALPQREISGIVKDTTDVGLPGVTVRLTSEKDTLVISTNTDGIFVFKNVKSASYTLSVSMMSYKPFVGKFKQNDAIARIVMDPVILK
ncbi:MAG: carboxypeptidase regulatory-like domain-containing protein, partial [Pedobacter sp.]